MVLCSHDMFLKPESYYLDVQSEAIIALYNGTWNRSDNSIDRNRMIDVSIINNGQRHQIDTTQWTEENNATLLHLVTGSTGTYVGGVSTYSRDFKMSAEAFNDYLKHDGVVDMLDWRRDNDALGDPANERYSKHVKTIFQVGDTRTNDWNRALGYPIEFIPLSNPYGAEAGGELAFKLLRDGVPLPNQLVYFGAAHDHEHHHDEGDDHTHDATQLTTDGNGIVTVTIMEEGIHYLRTIHMQLSNQDDLTHESNWATITFEVGHGHSHNYKQLFYLLGGIFILSLTLYLYHKKTS